MLAHGRQTIPVRGVVGSRVPFKFWWAQTISISGGTADRFRCCQLRWTVSVVNWWRSSVTNLSHWPSTSVYNTVGVRHRVARVCQRHSGDLYSWAISTPCIGRIHKQTSKKKSYERREKKMKMMMMIMMMVLLTITSRLSLWQPRGDTYCVASRWCLFTSLTAYSPLNAWRKWLTLKLSFHCSCDASEQQICSATLRLSLFFVFIFPSNPCTSGNVAWINECSMNAAWTRQS